MLSKKLIIILTTLTIPHENNPMNVTIVTNIHFSFFEKTFI